MSNDEGMTKSQSRNSLLTRPSSFAIRASSLLLVSYDPPPQAFRPPDAGAQTFQLHDLAVIDEEIHICAVVFDVPREHIGIGGFEHQPFRPDLVNEFRRYIGPPRINILGDAFALNHDDLCAGFEKPLCLRDRPARIACAFCLQLCGCCCAASTELN